MGFNVYQGATKLNGSPITGATLFTHAGVWGFNSRYTVGANVAGLPLEEILFFFCIPYASLFTYFALNYLIGKDHLFPHQELITSLLIIVLLIAGLYNIHKAYTATTFLLRSMLFPKE